MPAGSGSGRRDDPLNRRVCRLTMVSSGAATVSAESTAWSNRRSAASRAAAGSAATSVPAYSRIRSCSR